MEIGTLVEAHAEEPECFDKENQKGEVIGFTLSKDYVVRFKDGSIRYLGASELKELKR